MSPAARLRAFGVLAALLWLWLAFDGARRLSAASDEVAHIGAGLAAVLYGDLRLNPEHPPLFKAACAALPALMGAEVPLARDGSPLVSWLRSNQWPFGYYALFIAGNDPLALLFRARIVPILAALAGGLLAWRWAAAIGGARAGLLAMVALLFYPEYLGHGRYVTFDVPTLASCGAISLAAWGWWRRPGAKAGAVFAACSAVLALVKLPVAMFAVLCLATMAVLAAVRRARGRAVLALAFATALAAYAAQWAGAGFRWRVDSQHFPAEELSVYAKAPAEPEGAVMRAADFAERWRLLPQATLAVLRHTTSFEGRLVFLDGENSRTGWYRYFFVTMWLKTPLLYLAMLGPMAWGAARTLRRGHGLAKERLVLLAVPFLALFALTAASRVNIGHRHMLFLYFPWCVLMGAELARWWRRHAWAGPAAAAACVAAAALSHPNQATYFNALAGGSPYGAMGRVADSNIDWGQGLPEAAEALRRLDLGPVNLAYFGMGQPEAWGIRDFRFIIPSYPFAMGMPPGMPPDPQRATLVSLNCIATVRELYPGLFDGEPDAILNSMVIYMPESLRRP